MRNPAALRRCPTQETERPSHKSEGSSEGKTRPRVRMSTTTWREISSKISGGSPISEWQYVLTGLAPIFPTRTPHTRPVFVLDQRVLRLSSPAQALRAADEDSGGRAYVATSLFAPSTKRFHHEKKNMVASAQSAQTSGVTPAVRTVWRYQQSRASAGPITTRLTSQVKQTFLR